MAKSSSDWLGQKAGNERQEVRNVQKLRLIMVSSYEKQSWSRERNLQKVRIGDSLSSLRVSSHHLDTSKS